MRIPIFIQYVIFFLVIFTTTNSSLFSQVIFSNGEFKLFYPRKDSIYLKGEYKDSHPHGKWTYFSDEVPFFFRTNYTYQNGMLNGEFIETMKGGIVLEQGTYINNKKHGTWCKYNFKGELNESITYKYDTLHGPFYNTNYTINFYNGTLHGHAVFLNHTNYKRIEGNYQYGLREGKWIYHNRNGNFEVLNFVNDTLNGPYYIYNKTHSYYGFDSIIETGTYLNNKQHGLQTVKSCYYLAIPNKAHCFTIEKNFANGVQHGIQRRYKNKDILMSECNYVNGYRDGFCYEWTDSGVLTDLHLFAENEQYDSFIKWHYTLGIKREEYLKKKKYSPGQYHKIYRSAQQGWPATDSFYLHDGKRVFDHYTYGHKGQIIIEYHIVNGRKNGRWYKEGDYEFEYKDDILVKTISAGYLEDDFKYRWKKYFREFKFEEEGDYLVERTSADENTSYYQSLNPRFDTRYYTLTRQSKYLYTPISNDKYLKTYIFPNVLTDSLKLKGKVVFRCHVNAEGFLSSPILIQSLHPAYDAVALRAILMVSRNSRSNGMIIPYWTDVTIEF